MTLPLNRRAFIISGTIGAASLLSGCQMFGPSGGGAQIQATYQQAIAAQDAAAVLFNAGAALVTADVLKTGTVAHRDVDVAFMTLSAALDAVNTDIQAGTPQPIALLLDAATKALTAAQQALAKSKDAANKSAALRQMAKAPAATQRIALPVILELVTQLLPVVIQAGGALADLIRNGIGGTSTPNGPTYSTADVQVANNQMRAGLSAWESAEN